MTLLDAVSIRTSLRSYRPEPISTVQQQQLEKTISQLNASSGLRIQLASAPFPKAMGCSQG